MGLLTSLEAGVGGDVGCSRDEDQSPDGDAGQKRQSASPNAGVCKDADLINDHCDERAR
jgi:hypothetical protein